MADSTSIKRLVIRLSLMVVVMFAFGFALVPIYDVMCRAFGINGKTAGQYEGEQVVDTLRQVRVQFLATNNLGMVWEFYPKGEQLVVNPGGVYEMVFVASNPPTIRCQLKRCRASHRRKRRSIFTRPSVFASPNKCCNRGSALKCRCALSSIATCPRT